MMNMGWPQVVVITLLAIEWGITAANHGKPKTGAHNAWSALVIIGMWLVVLTEGGFFR